MRCGRLQVEGDLGRKIESSFGHVKYMMPIQHPTGDIEQEDACASLEIREESKAGDRKLRMNDITKNENTDKEKIKD